MTLHYGMYLMSEIQYKCITGSPQALATSNLLMISPAGEFGIQLAVCLIGFCCIGAGLPDTGLLFSPPLQMLQCQPMQELPEAW